MYMNAYSLSTLPSGPPTPVKEFQVFLDGSPKPIIPGNMCTQIYLVYLK